MSRHELIWAAVPHTGDGVVFQLLLNHGHQLFHMPRDMLEAVFGLERGASDARELELFYAHSNCIFARACAMSSRSSTSIVRLHADDFSMQDENEGRISRQNARQTIARRAA